MELSLVQFADADGRRGVAAVAGDHPRIVVGAHGVIDRARRSLATGQDLAPAIDTRVRSL